MIVEVLDSPFNSLQFSHKFCMIRIRNKFGKRIWSW